jgi:hypothetical protein
MNFDVRVRVVVCLTFWAVLASGQGPRIHSEYGRLAGPDGDLPRKRELWFRQGRVFPGQSPAALLTGKKYNSGRCAPRGFTRTP